MRLSTALASLPLALALISACRNNRTTPPAPSATSTPVNEAPPPLMLRAELAPLVDELAKLHGIEGSSVGEGGSEGDFYGLWLKFQARATRSDFAILASDPRPVVRAMGWLGVAQDPSEGSTSLLIGRLSDQERVLYCPGGCTCFTMPIGNFARALLVNAHHLSAFGSYPADAGPPPSMQPLPLVTKRQLYAVDLEILANDQLAPLPYESALELGRAIHDKQLALELPALIELARFRKLSLPRVIKAVGRIEREPAPGYPTLNFLVRALHDTALATDARLAAASALTRFVDLEAERAIDQEREFLDGIGPEPLGARLASEIRLRRTHAALMKPIIDAHTIQQTEPLADRAIRAFGNDHPMVFDDLESTGSFGKADDRVYAVRAATLVRMVKRQPEFSQPWNTYADTIYAVSWFVSGERTFSKLTDKQLEAVREALQSAKK